MTCGKRTSATASLNAVTTKNAFHLIPARPIAEYSPKPELRIIKAGTIDGNDMLKEEALQPLVEQYMQRRAPWLCAAGIAQQGASSRERAAGSAQQEARSAKRTAERAQQFEAQQDASELDDKLANMILQGKENWTRRETLPRCRRFPLV
ncbi:hypothetical protein B0A55_11814 [Friedmanniomyces simplex]|uniref:Uncharacterized protein n=1 Tax=Friedmanniomyces simplex TaxID=329884 RepID=A0A4U0WJ93_9PEZI|nr:hypothetical protein B0A55_11814 [Friedmanniomyces simplex]